MQPLQTCATARLVALLMFSIFAPALAIVQLVNIVALVALIAREYRSPRMVKQYTLCYSSHPNPTSAGRCVITFVEASTQQ